VRSGRPPNDLLDIRILALLAKRPSHSGYSIAEALGISKSTILSYLRESLGMKIVSNVGSRTSQRPLCNRFGWKLAVSYCPFSRLTRK
jgi:DNA-binding Lrp family transcriptional regulator